jgi:hypothetical protein
MTQTGFWKADIMYACIEFDVSFEDEELYLQSIAGTTLHQP